MENSSQLQQVCSMHQLELKYVNPYYPNDKLVCRQCIDKIDNQRYMKSKKKDITRNILEQCNKNLDKFKQFIDSIKQFKESLIEGINIVQNIIETIGTQIENTKNEIQQLQQKSQTQMDILESHEKYLEEERNQKKNVAQNLEMLKFDENLNELIKKLDKLDFQSLAQWNLQQKQELKPIRVETKVKEPILDQSPFEINQKMYEYELLPQSTLKIWGEQCSSMDVNNEVSKVAVGCYPNIKVFDLNNDQLSNPQILKGHDNQITCIQFFKHSNQFLSTGYDAKINLWQQNNKNEWVIIQNLDSGNRFYLYDEGHVNFINCLIINQNEDMILTGSKDNSIISWIWNNHKWVYNERLECQSQVWSLSLNESNTKLISLEANKLINVFEINLNKWIHKQNIQLESQGFRIGFVSDSEFTFQPEKSQYLLFYKYNNASENFEKDYQVDVNTGNQDENGFPISLIKSKNILIAKNCQYLNILQRRDGKFTLNYSIQFNSHNFSGCISRDGEYLITRDSQAISYQIRKLKEKM